MQGRQGWKIVLLKKLLQFIFYVVGCNIDNFCLSYAFASMVVMGVQTTWSIPSWFVPTDHYLTRKSNSAKMLEQVCLVSANCAQIYRFSSAKFWHLKIAGDC